MISNDEHTHSILSAVEPSYNEPEASLDLYQFYDTDSIVY